MAEINKIVVDGNTEYGFQDIDTVCKMCALANYSSKNMIIKQTFNVKFNFNAGSTTGTGTITLPFAIAYGSVTCRDEYQIDGLGSFKVESCVYQGGRKFIEVKCTRTHYSTAWEGNLDVTMIWSLPVSDFLPNINDWLSLAQNIGFIKPNNAVYRVADSVKGNFNIKALNAVPGNATTTLSEGVVFSFTSGSTTATGNFQMHYSKIKYFSVKAQPTQTQYGDIFKSVSATTDEYGDLRITITLNQASTRTYTENIPLDITFVFDTILDYLENTSEWLGQLYPSSSGLIQTITVVELDEHSNLRESVYDIRSSSKWVDDFFVENYNI